MRGGQAGTRFRRQHPIGSYIVDCYAAAARLAIEIDGKVHDGRREADARRDIFLRENGHRVIHVVAAEALRDPDTVAASIAMLVENPLHQPAAGPPPRTGEDQ